MKLLPFGLAHAFLMAPKEDPQGSGTGMDFDDAADDALVAEGEAELDTSEDGDPEPEDDPDAQSEEDEEDLDDEEDQGEEEEEGEEEDVDEEEEEVAASPQGFKFKGKDGNFDWKRINKVLGDDTLEKAIREQNSTITKYSQRVKELEGIETSPKFVESRNKAGFFDHLMQTHPKIREEVLKVLHGEQAGQQGNQQLPPGVDPNDPLAPVVLQLSQTVQALQNRTREEQQRQQQQELENRFVKGLHGARAKFKELTGKDASDEQIKLVADEMQKTGVLEGARFVADLFYNEIQDSIRQRVLRENAEKRKKLGPSGTGRKTSSKATKRSKEEEFDALWEQHVASR